MRLITTVGLSLAVLIVSATAWAKETQTGQRHQTSDGKEKAAIAVRDSRVKPPRATRTAVWTEHRRQEHDRNAAAQLPPPDRYIGPLRVVGPREVGKAAWYGGGRIGARTASGERLDTIHATAAHRSLPLHSLVRVTNLSNGRSAIVTINDRGPVSRSLLIDLSPRVADDLEMRQAGICNVSIEPVVETIAAH